MSSISFDNVYLLLIAVPVFALLSVPFFIAVKKDNANGHNIASMALHVVMAILIAFAAAGTQITAVITKTQVYAVADVSFSAEKNLDTLDGYIKNLGDNLPRNSKLGVVCFGKDCKITTELGSRFRTVRNSGVDDSETNIAEALEYAGTLFDDGVIKRIVLITDGRQTYGENTDNIRQTVEKLHSLGVYVDAMYLDDNIKENAREVQISSADFTDSVYVGARERVNLQIQSSFITNATVKLTKGGEDYLQRTVTLATGLNTVSIELDTQEQGTYLYRAEVSAENDEISYNNSYSFSQQVEGDLSVLFIGGSRADADKVKELYGETCTVTSYVNNPQVPCSVEELCRFDEIVLSEADLTAVNNYEMFLSSLDTVVSQFGKSLVTFGDLAIQNKEEDELRQLDDMLPVRYGDVDNNPKLYTIVLDISRSMQTSSRMIIARKAAKQLIQFLSDDDYVCVVAFAGDVYVMQSPASLETCRDSVNGKLDSFSFEQGTLMGIGLNMALKTISALEFSEKQVMLISDGKRYEDINGSSERNDAEYAVNTMSGFGIQTSVLTVGGQNENFRAYMRNLANLGGGKYYLAETEAALSSVLFEDIIKDVADPIVKRNTWIKVKRTQDNIIKDVDMTDTYVSEYVLGKAKASASTVLALDHEVKNVEIEVPLLSYWNYGNGKVFTYTGKIDGMKVRGGDRDKLNGEFFTGLCGSATPSRKVDTPYTLSVTGGGKLKRIELSPAEFRATAAATATVKTPSGQETGGEFIFDSSLYYFEFVTPDDGEYTVDITYAYGENEYKTQKTVYLCYAPEYDAFATFDASDLYRIVGNYGSVSENGKLNIENDEKEIGIYTLHLTMPLLIITVVLFVVDIVVRKLKWNDIVSLFNGRRKKK